MAVRARRTRFRSRVGWRVLSLFALTGLAPVILTAHLAYQESEQALRETVLTTLREQAKLHGMRILGAIDAANDIAREATGRHDAGLTVDEAILDRRASRITAVYEGVYDGGLATFGGGQPPDFDASQVDVGHLLARGSQLVLTGERQAQRLAILTATERTETSGDFLLFPLGDEILSIPEVYRPAETDFCSFLDNGELLTCTSDEALGVAQAMRLHGRAMSAADAEPQPGSPDTLAASWELFLKGKYAAPSIRIIAVTDKDAAFASISEFQRVFPPIITFVSLLVCLASFRVVRGSLVPLQELARVTQDFADGQLGTRAKIRTGDEFEDVGRAFNTMAEHLHAQFDTLRSIAAIDRMIADSATVERLSEVFIDRAMQIHGIYAAVVLVLDRENPASAQLYGGQAHDLSSCTIPVSTGFRHLASSIEAADWLPIHEAGLDRKLRAKLRGSPYVMPLPIMFDNACKGIVILGADREDCLTKGLMGQLRDLAAHVGVGIASTEREEDLYRQAHYDGLTGLPNRQLLRDRVSQVVKQTLHDGSTGAMLFLDLDRFKSINDVFGHSAGDFVLKEAGMRVLDEVWDGCTVARLGGDEFVILVPNSGGDAQIDDLASRIVTALSRPFEVQGDEQYLGASIGIVLLPTDGESFEMLLRNADSAMYRAKEAGRSRYEYFSEKLNAANQRRVIIERDLRRALHSQTLEINYQPQFSMDSRELRGAEALLRWTHPTWGPIRPSEFIPIAESSDLIIDLGLWVLDRTCQDVRRLLDAGIHPGIISINVSARQLRDPHIASRVAGTLSKYRINPGFLELEITESVVAQNKDTAIGILGRLRSLGIKIAMDDFGTGYSSLSYFQQLPFDTVKIDQSFVRELGADENAENICKAIISMSKQLDKAVIAEGIESERQAGFLRKNGCEIGQGFYFAKPMSFDDFVSFVEKQTDHTLRRKALEVV
jgi:diguanylate cyclase (GGDEF)-like protein